MNKGADVIIIGGGVIGCSIAYYLSKEGIKVILLEKNDLASGASGSCDKAAILQSKNPGIHLEIAKASVELLSKLTQELDDFELEVNGGMVLIESELQYKTMVEYVKRQQAFGLDVRLLNIKEAMELQPALSPKLLGSTYCPEDAELYPIKLVFSFARAAKRLGAQLDTFTEVTGIEKKKTGFVTYTSNGQYEAPTVVNAAGAWAPKVGEMLGIVIPIEPRKGQIVVTEPIPQLIKGDILCATYIATKYNPDLLNTDPNDIRNRLGIALALGQATHGNMLIGGCREFVGYDLKTNFMAIKYILENATRFIPALQKVHAIRSFAGVRPYTPDKLPIVGWAEDIDNFFIAAGHEGDGIALSAITGKITSEMICGKKLTFDTSAISPRRFKQGLLATS
jgi:sarcosine oxidase subunit beta